MWKNRILYLLVLLFGFLLLLLREHRYTYLIVYVMVFLPLLSGIMLLISRYVLCITEQIESDIISKEQSTVLRLKLKNRSILPFWRVLLYLQYEIGLSSSESSSEELHSVFLPARKSRVIDCYIRGQYTGNWKVQLSHLYVYDYLGLFRMRIGSKKHEMNSYTIRVYPRLMTIDSPVIQSITTELSQITSNSVSNDLTHLTNLRPYQVGDGLKRVHWKASAKKNELITKEFIETEGQSVTCIVNRSLVFYNPQAYYEQVDALKESMIAVLHYCHQQHHPLLLSASDITTQPYSLEEIYQVITDMTFDSSLPYTDVLQTYTNESRNCSYLLLYTQAYDATFLPQLKSLITKGNKVMLFTLERCDSNQEEELKQMGISIHVIDSYVNNMRNYDF